MLNRFHNNKFKIFTILQNISKEESNPEQQLISLRTHLLALGQTEGQLKELREKACDSSTKTEYSIVEVLQLWQTIFQETFQQYHRLSSRLVQSQDSASALRLWEEYLHHVQSFLSSGIPEDYASLTEHRHLCEVHENLLTSQQAVLTPLKNDSSQMVDQQVAEPFNALNNLHHQTLARITDRHGEIVMRLSAWDKYRNDQTRLLDWLKEKEKERTRLQLRYINLRRVPTILQHIEALVKQLPHGEAEAENLRKQQSHFLHFCDEALATSIRMEHASITQRIANLRAALETWRDFLEKILNLSKSYNTKLKHLQNNFGDVQNIVTNTSKNIPSNYNSVQKVLVKLRNERVRVNDFTPELEAINVIQEELKECISPIDMKTIRQMVSILWQQQADLDQQLSNLILQLEERLSLSTLFYAKYERLMQWMDTVELRINSDSQSLLTDPEELMREMEKELQSEMDSREREREWLLSSGRELLTFYNSGTDQDIQNQHEIKTKLDKIVDRWEKLKYLCKSRSNKIHDLKMTVTRLEERIALIRAWLYTMEVELSKPITFENITNKDIINVKLQEHDKIQRAIEMESSNVGDVLNLSEMLFSDVDTWKAHFNTSSLFASVDNLEKRWTNVCSMSADRKRQIISTWTLLQELLQQTNAEAEWLKKQEKTLKELEKGLKKLNKEQAQDRIHVLEEKIKEFEARSPDFKSIEQLYSKLARSNHLDADNIKELTSGAQTMLTRYRALVPKALDIIGMLNMDMKTYREFINHHGRAVVSLTQIDAELTQLQHLTKPSLADNPEEQLRQLQVLEQELKICESDLANADKLGLVIMKKSKPDDIQSIQLLIDEYQTLWHDVNKRIANVKTNIKTKVEKLREPIERSVQVSRTFETDSAVQVNTLPGLSRMTSITPKDAYIYELAAAIKECCANLNQLEQAVEDPTKKPGSQVVSKLMSNSQSSVELMNHLSTILITECFCTNEEAEVQDVAELCAKYETLVALWKAKERQHQENRYAISFCFSSPVFFFGFAYFFYHYINFN